MRRSHGKLAVSVVALGLVVWLASAATADSIGPITFEQSQGYIPGTINGQPTLSTLPNGKWTKLGPYDVNVVPVSLYAAASGYGFGSQTLQISDAVTSGSFGDQTFSPGLADEAGEAGADNAGLSGGLRQPHFDASFLIGTTQAEQQCVGCTTSPPDVEPNPLHMSVSPDRG